MITPTSNHDHFTADASDIGFAVGVWPVSFVWNGMTFYRIQMIWTGFTNEVGAAEYRTSTGVGMTVFND